MITVPRYFRAAIASMILTTLSVAGDMPGITTNSDWVAADPPYHDRPGRDPGGLETRRPYERGKVPVVLVHGLHICLESPGVIREVHRILREHAGIDPTSRTDHGGLAQRGLESRREK